MSNLKPCPFCGCKDIHFFAFRIDPEMHVTCDNCGASIYRDIPCDNDTTAESHEEKGVKILTELWNRRVNNDKT